jgi:myxalamid-type polyketide synthase MxaB
MSDATGPLLDRPAKELALVAERARATPGQCFVGEAAAGDWLIVERSGGLAGPLADRLARAGGRVVVADAAQGAPLGRQRVVYLCAGDDGPDPPAEAEAACAGLLRLVQALGRAGCTGRLWVVTRGCQAVSEAEPVNAAQAALWGLARTVRFENPELRTVSVDLAPGSADLDPLVAEMLAPGEAQVAYRRGTRHVARLARHRDKAATEVSGPFRLQLAGYGSPDNLRLVPLTRRPPGPGEVEIEVKAAALNFRDVLIALGMLREYYERALKIHRAEDVRLGFDCAGVVAAVGEGVSDFRVGDEVMTSYAGSSASFLTLPRIDVVH